jgi:putative oxidoreductase
MNRMLLAYDRAVAALDAKLPEGLALLFVRVALAGVFWRSGRTKVVEGSWFDLSDTTFALFREEYSAVPLPPVFAAYAAATAEHLFPILLVLGLATRFSALALLAMTMVIQIFVYPEAWWPVHSLWVALASILIVRGGGVLSLDAALPRRRRA